MLLLVAKYYSSKPLKVISRHAARAAGGPQPNSGATPPTPLASHNTMLPSFVPLMSSIQHLCLEILHCHALHTPFY